MTMTDFQDLAELRDALNDADAEFQNNDSPADFSQYFYRKHGFTLDALPTFSKYEPDDTMEIFSWDDDEVLILNPDEGNRNKWIIIGWEEYNA